MAKQPIKLTPADKKMLEDLEGDIDWMAKEIEKAKACKLDVTQLEADFKKAVEQRNLILRTYG